MYVWATCMPSAYGKQKKRTWTPLELEVQMLVATMGCCELNSNPLDEQEPELLTLPFFQSPPPYF